MSSVETQVTCPHCKSEDAFEETYTRTCECFFFCPQCGICKEENLQTGIVQFARKGKGTLHAVFNKKYGSTSALSRRLPPEIQFARLKKWSASPRRELSSLTFTYRDSGGKWQVRWVVGAPARKKSWKHKPVRPTIHHAQLKFMLELPF